MKTFIYLELPHVIKNELRHIQKQLPSHVEPVDFDKLHLTLRFVGLATCDQQCALSDALARIDFKRFDLRLSNVGLFDNFYKVFWCGVNGQLDQLFSLAGRIESTCQLCGKADFAFYPHITLGRSRQKAEVSHILVNPVQFVASTIHLAETT